MNPISKHLVARWVWRSLGYHAWGNLGTLVGATVAIAVLVGALVVGDCVRGSLREIQEARLGQVDFALATRDRFFQDDLGVRFQKDSIRSAAVLQTMGSVANGDNTLRANRVQILGVNDAFWQLAPKPGAAPFHSKDGIVVNEALSRRLGLKTGDSLLIRVPKPSYLPADDLMAPRDEVSYSLRLTVDAVIKNDAFGRFSLQANQNSPLTVFVPLQVLQARLELTNKANLMLVSAPSQTVSNLASRLHECHQVSDEGLKWRELPNGFELVSDRIFLDEPVVTVALNCFPAARSISTYFVNEIKHGNDSTPYSMVTAMGEPVVPQGLHTNEVVINSWLAEDLKISPGQSLELSYFVMNPTRRLDVKHVALQVHSITPMEGIAADKNLMPDFPGLANAEKTENWDAGFPLDMKRIRPKDEQYWKDHRGTPKAFVSLATGKRLWGEDAGFTTAIRFEGVSRSAVEGELLKKLDPVALGFVFLPVRELAVTASSQAEDFGGLFMGFSFFLIVAALILLGILFQFSLERRASEAGILLALGLRPRQVGTLLALESLGIAALGGGLGMLGGLAYAKGILIGLTTLWSAAVAESYLGFHWTWNTLLGGVLSGMGMCFIVLVLALRKQMRRPARELLEQGVENMATDRRHWAGWLTLASGLVGAGLVGVALFRGNSADVEAFFFGGMLLLISGISCVAMWLRPRGSFTGTLTWSQLALRQCKRRCKRSLAVVALLASGSFLIVAIDANKLDATRDCRERSSGTGGFALVGESTMPVVQDLNTSAGREFFGLEAMPDVTFVPMRVHDGDEASCLNLNRAQMPRIMGVTPELLQARKAFTFVKTLSESHEPWLLLKEEKDLVPAIADDASATWALGKKVGDRIPCVDGLGRPFELLLVGTVANSILQGSLLIDEKAFIRLFPGEGGHRFFLIDSPDSSATGVAKSLTHGLEDRGLEVVSASQRLSTFNAVQNTYLNTFQVLGGLGLLLGSAGLGAVVLRNLLERRREWAILRVVGFKRGSLIWLAMLEHGFLLTVGLAVGVGAALIAVIPVVFSPGVHPSWGWIGTLIVMVYLSGFVWIWLAARTALRGEALDALRRE